MRDRGWRGRSCPPETQDSVPQLHHPADLYSALFSWVEGRCHYVLGLCQLPVRHALKWLRRVSPPVTLCREAVVATRDASRIPAADCGAGASGELCSLRQGIPYGRGGASQTVNHRSRRPHRIACTVTCIERSLSLQNERRVLAAAGAASVRQMQLREHECHRCACPINFWFHFWSCVGGWLSSTQR